MKRTFFIFLCILICGTHLIAQQETPKGAFLEKWENSKNYLLEVIKAMPEEDFGFKPTDRQMSFEEQLLHIQKNIEWLTNKYFQEKDAPVTATDGTKEALIKSLTQSFENTSEVVTSTTEEELAETVSFFAGPKSRLQILNLLQDHLTHHRGQLIVYLNLKGIEPPSYVGW
jgi:uncharacterized damage-inducible protein DinB